MGITYLHLTNAWISWLSVPVGLTRLIQLTRLSVPWCTSRSDFSLLREILDSTNLNVSGTIEERIREVGRTCQVLLGRRVERLPHNLLELPRLPHLSHCVPLLRYRHSGDPQLTERRDRLQIHERVGLGVRGPSQHAASHGGPKGPH